MNTNAILARWWKKVAQSGWDSENERQINKLEKIKIHAIAQAVKEDQKTLIPEESLDNLEKQEDLIKEAMKLDTESGITEISVWNKHMHDLANIQYSIMLKKEYGDQSPTYEEPQPLEVPASSPSIIQPSPSEGPVVEAASMEPEPEEKKKKKRPVEVLLHHVPQIEAMKDEPVLREPFSEPEVEPAPAPKSEEAEIAVTQVRRIPKDPDAVARQERSRPMNKRPL